MSLHRRAHQRVDQFRPFRRRFETPDDTEHHRVTTEDGLGLVLRRLPGKTADVQESPRPVMLLHGLASNHRGFHFPGRSFAAHLAARGHEVWLPELRGNGDSEVGGYHWTLDDHLERDLPAIVAYIRAHSGSERITWVGHSMGGMLLLCWGIRHGHEAIARGITVGSALDYRLGGTGFSAIHALKPLLERFTAIPFGTLAHLAAPLHGRIGVLDRFQVWPANIEAEMTRRLHATAFHTMPTSLLRSLAGAIEAGGLQNEKGLRFLDATERYEIETLMVAGSRDAQVSVEAVTETARRLRADLQIFGQQQGQAEEYGHWDLLIGRRATEETWPVLTDFLEA